MTSTTYSHVPKNQIKDIQPSMTIVGGNIVYEHKACATMKIKGIGLCAWVNTTIPALWVQNKDTKSKIQQMHQTNLSVKL